MYQDLQNHKRKDTVKWVIAFTLIAVLFVGMIVSFFHRRQEREKEQKSAETVRIERGNDETIYPLPRSLSLTSAALASSETGTIDVQIFCEVYPENAANKEVDYSVAWKEGATRANEPVTDYLTVTPYTDGSCEATVSCKKPFNEDKIIITVTTRDGGFTDTCTVSFVGIASSMDVDFGKLPQRETAERGVYHELGNDRTYQFEVNLTNELGFVSKDITVTAGAVGRAYFGDQYANDAFQYNYYNMYERDLSEVVDWFFPSITVSENIVTVKTGKRILEEAYASYEVDENLNSYSKDAYVVELDDNWNVQDETAEHFYVKEALTNAQRIKNFYFYLTFKDNVSGLTKQARFWFVASTTGVIIQDNLTI